MNTVGENKEQLKSGDSQNSTSDLSSSIMEKIDQGEVQMRSPWYFISGSIVLGLGMVGFILVSIFMMTAISFQIRTMGVFYFLRFGLLGFRPFLEVFPWIPLLLAISGIWGGIYLLKKYDFSYKYNFISLAISTIIAIIGIGFISDYLGLPVFLQKLPVGQHFYAEKYANYNWVRGQLVELDVNANEAELQTPLGQEIIVIWVPKQTMMPSEDTFKVGQHWQVIGEWESTVFNAEAIQEITPPPFCESDICHRQPYRCQGPGCR